MSSSTEPSTATKVSEPAPIASEEKPKVRSYQLR